MTSSNIHTPDSSLNWFDGQSFKNYWELTTSNNPNWIPINLWSNSDYYDVSGLGKLIIHNDIIYSSDELNFIEGDVPGEGNSWVREYGLKADSNFVYTSDNPIVSMNGTYYIINNNPNSEILDNGICIYINNKWKNIFINIEINDNTLDNLSETNRDDLYKDIYTKLSANNFINSINDISNKNGYINYIKYYIIDENGNINNYSYDNNITNLPNIVTCEFPDSLSIKLNSLIKDKAFVPNKLKSTKILKDGEIDDISKLNWFNNTQIAYTIEENSSQPKEFVNYHGNKNIINSEVYRYSGYYMPLFYDIELFEKNYEYNRVGNYKFNTTLTNFGLIMERKFNKINKNGSLLKLESLYEYKSIYPMVDEIGYSVGDLFIFKSTWDINYHIETSVNDVAPFVNNVDINMSELNFNIGQPMEFQNKNYNL